MIVEIALFAVHAGQQAVFEAAWREIGPTLARQPGYRSHRFGRQAEDDTRYVLEVDWDSLSAHQAFMAHADFEPFVAAFRHLLREQAAVFHFAP